jgi:hypothetical protein
MQKHGKKHHSKDPRKLAHKARGVQYDLSDYSINIVNKNRYKKGLME